jgi:hypothetical protein
MKSYLLLVAAFSMAACSSVEERQQVGLMNTIESKVRFPPNAGKIERFARVYKFGSPGHVEAFYFVPDGQHDQWFCEEAKSGGRTNGQVVLACPPPVGMKAGERRWFGEDVYLPNVNDGGCDFINVIYEISSQTVASATCNGFT